MRDATDGNLTLQVDPGAGAMADVKPRNYGTFAGGDWLSCSVRMPRRADELRTRYEIRGLGDPLRIDDVAVPERGQAPRIAVVSCNGVQNKRDWTSRPEMEATWDALWGRHRQPTAPDGSGGPYHILIGAGDQVYCDAVWEDVPELRALRTWKQRRAKKVSARLERQIETAPTAPA